jgi:hypothetical protein
MIFNRVDRSFQTHARASSRTLLIGTASGA